MRIGILALQGAFIEHSVALRSLGATTVDVRLPQHLEGIDGLVIPGGESTTIGKLMIEYAIKDDLTALARDGLPIFGTCAGLIVLAKTISGQNQPLIGAMDITVDRNAFGSQVDSFETDLVVPTLGDTPFRAVFIRAPIITSVGPDVMIMANLPNGSIVAAREDNLLATAFHPELTSDTRFHRYFLQMVRDKKAEQARLAPRSASGVIHD